MADATNTQTNQASGGAQAQPTSQSVQIDPKLMFLLSYFVLIIGGIIAYIIYGEKDKRVKFHAIQSIIYGIIIIIIVSIIDVIILYNYFLLVIPNLISLLMWLYGLYIGYKAYTGTDVPMPFLTDFIKQNIKM
ncbi:MAG: hypothetical protein ACP5RI_03265 [Candidatus Micrarchaeia archaeon]